MTAKELSLKNSKARNAGTTFEDIISDSCEYYEEIGIAKIEKTPEPMRTLRPLGRGRYEAVYTKQAQPDFKGTLKGGRAIAFEAKHTDTDRIKRDVISIEQQLCLDAHEELGAECFVLISFGFRHFYKVPWCVFRDMKGYFGFNHIKETAIAEWLTDMKKPHFGCFECKYTGNRLKFLSVV